MRMMGNSFLHFFCLLIKEFDRQAKDLESRNDPNANKMLNDKKKKKFNELNSYVALKKQYVSNLENKRIGGCLALDLFDHGSTGFGEDNVLLASSMTNQQLIDSGNRMMDKTDQAIGGHKRRLQTVQGTINVGTETAAALKDQTEQMSRSVNQLDSIHFPIKKASQLVKELGRQVATDKCIMALLFLIVIGVIAIIIVKFVNPNNKDIRDIPGLAPPAITRKLLWSAS
nr:novel plant SNARE 11-like [Quercus suber]